MYFVLVLQPCKYVYDKHMREVSKLVCNLRAQAVHVPGTHIAEAPALICQLCWTIASQ